MRTCYMCDRAATSDEHAPPQCLFPEKRDAFGRDYRKNLITVPSCDEHNQLKSNEDVFLLAYLAGLEGNNEVGRNHNGTKVARCTLNSTDAKMLQLLSKAQGNKSDSPAVDALFRAIVIRVNAYAEVRLHNCFEHIARALYFHQHRSRFYGHVAIHLSHHGFLSPFDADDTKARRLINLLADQEFSLDTTTEGENKEVFHYSFTPESSDGFILLRMVFYGNAPIYAAMQPVGVKLPETFEVCMPIDGELVTLESKEKNSIASVIPHPFALAPHLDDNSQQLPPDPE